MDEILRAFKLLTSNGVGFLRLFDELSPYDLARDGIEITLAKKYARLADDLFGPCDSPRLQRESIALAQERELSVNQLLMINKHAKNLKARGAAWKLRADLIARAVSLEEVEAYAKKRGMAEGSDKPKQRGGRLGRVVGGLRTIRITDTQRSITDLEKTLDAADENDNHRPRSEALLEPFWDLVHGNDTGLIKPEYRTVIAIGLDDFAKVSCGKGEDVVVALSDGTT